MRISNGTNQETKDTKKWKVMKTVPGVVAEVEKKKGLSLSRSPIYGLMGVACQISSSCSELSLHDYCLLSITFDCNRFSC